jgi:lipopolysaccharide export system protein LptA
MNRDRLPAFRLIAAVAFVVIAGFAAGAARAATADLFNGFQDKSKDPIQVDATVLDITEQGKQRVSEFSGNVVVHRGPTTLKADSIKLYSDINATTSDGFTRIEANGNVFVSSGPQTLTGKTAVVDMKAQTITVSGGVVLSQGTNVITGSRLLVNLATGEARVEQDRGKQIRGIFTPSTVGGKTQGK